MSAVLDHGQAGHAGHDDHAHGHPHGWRRWVYATNHKDIVKLNNRYIVPMSLWLVAYTQRRQPWGCQWA